MVISYVIRGLLVIPAYNWSEPEVRMYSLSPLSPCLPLPIDPTHLTLSQADLLHPFPIPNPRNERLIDYDLTDAFIVGFFIVVGCCRGGDDG